MENKRPTKRSIGQMKVSEAVPVLKVAAFQFGLSLSNAKHFKAARRIVENSIEKN